MIVLEGSVRNNKAVDGCGPPEFGLRAWGLGFRVLTLASRDKGAARGMLKLLKVTATANTQWHTRNII